jgi:hypothetical protein
MSSSPRVAEWERLMTSPGTIDLMRLRRLVGGDGTGIPTETQEPAIARAHDRSRTS